MSRFILLLLVLLSYSVKSQKMGAFTDPRDNQIYSTVTYDIKHSKDSSSQMTWFAENLNFDSPKSKCLNNIPENCEKYNSRYYQWEDAMAACPSEWRLPNDQDWLQLVKLFGGMKKAGRHLKSKNDLWSNANGTNKSGFSGKAYGASDGEEHFQFGYAAFFWSSTVLEEDEREAYDWSFVTNADEVRQWGGYKLIYNCVRCVK